MSELVRFSVSLEGDLLERFGAFCVEGRYLYDHHLTKLTDRMIETQYSHATCVVSSMHVHLNHDLGIEVIAFRGPRRNSPRSYRG